MADAEPEPKPKHDESESLIVWSLGAFHAATLVAVLVALGHTAGALGDLLGGLNTVVGLALYLFLWGLSWGATRSVLARVPPATIETGGVGAAVAWGEGKELNKMTDDSSRALVHASLRFLSGKPLRSLTSLSTGSTRTVMSGDVYEIRQKTGETCRGSEDV